MQKKSGRKFSWSNWGVAGVLLATMLAAPLFALVSPAEAKPPAHAPAWGYRAKNDDDNHRERRRHTSKRRTRHYTPRRHTASKRVKKRRYRIFYRTRRDANGRRYRQYYRVYR
jgi:hypothetical protein